MPADGQSTTGRALATLAPTSGALVSFDDMERMAEAFAKSGLFGAKTKEQALSLLMIAQAEGIHPALAVMEYDIIEGKPARKAERLLARFQLSGGKVEWLHYTDERVTAAFSHPQGSAVEIEWTMEMARRMTYYARGSNGEQGRWKPLAEKYNWKNFPRAMLRSRCIAEGVRACFPGASLVTLTNEEAQDVQVLGVETVEDFDQRPADERPARAPYPSKLIGQAGKDAFDDLAQQMSEAVDADMLEIVWDEAERANLSANRMFALSEHYEACKEALETGKPTPQAPRFTEPAEPSPFAKLKEAGEAVRDKAGFAAWAATLKPETLGKCSEAERAELRTLYAAKKSNPAGAAGVVGEDAGKAENGGAAGQAGAEASPASSSSFEALKEACLACLQSKTKRRALSEWRKEMEAATGLSAPEIAELNRIEQNVREELSR